jgi:hypothetical protein
VIRWRTIGQGDREREGEKAHGPGT